MIFLLGLIKYIVIMIHMAAVGKGSTNTVIMVLMPF